MVATFIGKFKVETVWPELVGKRIQSIECNLKEISFSNRSGSLVAKGSLKRRVKYTEPDGRFRKVEDRLQFELILGDALPEPLPYLTAELHPDYFIFQPRRLGESQAVLEQGFTLVVKAVDSVPTFPQSLPFLVDKVSLKGKGSAIFSKPVNLKEDASPPKFIGTVEFERSKLPVVAGRLAGVIQYRTFENVLNEMEFNQPIGLMINITMKEPGQELIVNGVCKDICWIRPGNGHGWIMEVKVDYEWLLITPQILPLLVKKPGHDLSGRSIKAKQLIKEDRFIFFENFTLHDIKTESFQIELRVEDWRLKRVEAGLSLSATLAVDLFEADPSGTETYRKFQFKIEELAENFCVNIEAPEQLNIEVAPNVSLKKISLGISGWVLETIIEFFTKTYQLRVIDLAEPSSDAALIFALVYRGQNSFSLFGDASFQLSHFPLEVVSVKNRSLKISPLIQRGWLTIIGEAEIVITYVDKHRKLREDFFKINLQQSYVWDELNDEANQQVDLFPKLEYENYYVNGFNIFYKYLLKIATETFERSVLKAAVAGETSGMAGEGVSLSGESSFRANLEFSIAGEIDLRFGNPKEIAGSHAFIAEFHWRHAANAILAEGKIGGGVEYWDEDGYLRRETISFPFWNLIPITDALEGANYLPRLKRYSFYPLNPWPWRRGCVGFKAGLELVIHCGVNR